MDPVRNRDRSNNLLKQNMNPILLKNKLRRESDFLIAICF